MLWVLDRFSPYSARCPVINFAIIAIVINIITITTSLYDHSDENRNNAEAYPDPCREFTIIVIVNNVITMIITHTITLSLTNRNNAEAYPEPCREFTLKESFWFALTSFTPQVHLWIIISFKALHH